LLKKKNATIVNTLIDKKGNVMEDVLNFWFEELETKDWWLKSEELDRKIESRFGEIHKQAIAGALKSWRESPDGRLAEIIVLDQFSRNIFQTSF